MNTVRFLILVQQTLPSGNPIVQSVDLSQASHVKELNQLGFTEADIAHIDFYGSGHRKTVNKFGKDVFITLMKDQVREFSRSQPVQIVQEGA